jgi:two-component system, chemotaxis family, CheB/CheR fusion protein
MLLQGTTRMIGGHSAAQLVSSVGNKSTATVIVVDDDTSIRAALRRQLQILGFNVLDFHSAEEFLTSEVPIGDACILLDLYMPGMGGIELCRKLNESGRRLPTILISGRDDPKTRKMMREANPVASLIKPFDEKDLLRAIRKALGSRLDSAL